MKKTILIVAICIAAILVVLGGIALYSSLGAYGELKTAKNLLLSAKASLEKQDVQSAAASFAKAQNHFNKADSRLEAHKISIGFLKIVPYAGTQIRAVDRFVQIGTHLCKAGTLLSEAARGVPGIDAASAQDNASIGTMVDRLTRLGKDLAPVEQELLSAQRESRAMKTGWLIGSASRMKKELDQKLDATLGGLQKARKLMAALPSIVGAEGAPPKNYMVLQQDCYELRASRGLIPFVRDCRDRPEEVFGAAGDLIDSYYFVTRFLTSLMGIPRVYIALHRSSNDFLSPKMFAELAFPSLKKLVDKLVAGGISPVLHCDGNWDLNLEKLRELPAGNCVVQFDSPTDIFRAKEVIGDRMCIMGDVPAYMLCLGSTSEVDEFCHRLIEEVGRGGGFIMGAGCEIPPNASPANVKVMLDSVVKYGYYT
jgi:hypothetical protein